MKKLSFGARLWLSFVLPWRVIFNGKLAARIAQLDALAVLGGASDQEELNPADTGSSLEPSAQPTSSVDVVDQETDATPALQLLSILQREGRFLDFLQEEMSEFSDEEIGAAARVVQAGCKRCLNDYVTLEPIRSEEEGATVCLEAGYNASETRVTGNVLGQPPFSGSLAHHGWRVTRIELPSLSPEHDATVVAQAEVEL